MTMRQLLLASAFFAAPLLTVGVSDYGNISDIILVVYLTISVPTALRSGAVVGGRGAWLMVTLLMATCAAALVQATAYPQEAIRFCLAVMGALAAVVAWRARPVSVSTLMFAYGAGAATSAISAPLLGEITATGRWVGLSGRPNHLGLAAAIGLVGLAGVQAGSTALRGLVWVLRLVTGAGVIWSGSRTSIIIAIAGVAGPYFFYALRTRRVRAALAAVTAITLCFAASVWISDETSIGRLLGAESSVRSDADRDLRREGAWTQIEESPLFGSGFRDVHAAHSVYLQMWVSIGILGLVSAAAVAISTNWATKVALTSKLSSRRVDVRLCISSSVFMYLAVVNNQLWDRYIWLPFGIAIASVLDASSDTDVPAVLGARGPAVRRVAHA